MIQFYAYKANGRAPTARVARIGGIYRQADSGLIKVTLIDGDESRPAAQVHLLWQPWDWLATEEVLHFTMDQFRRGTFAAGGPRTH